MIEAESGYLEPDLASHVRVVVTTRVQKNLATHVNDDPMAVAANRAKLGKDLELINNPSWLTQVHGNTVVEVKKVLLEALTADGSYTNEPFLPLAILTADCLPVVLWSKSELAVVHAGWRGLANGILANAVAKFQHSVSAWIGPGIGPCHYEVDEPVAGAFSNDDAFIATRPGHYQFDLAVEARRQLRLLGVRSVQGAEICTACDPRFYSHRHEGPTGRFATLAWLVT